MTISIEEKKANALMWIESLSLKGSAAYPQGKGRLGDMEKGMCCLGLMCFLSDKPYYPGVAFPRPYQNSVGLINYGGSAADPSRWDNLSFLNDTGSTFRQIANVLKRNPHQYFVTEVADHIELAYW